MTFRIQDTNQLQETDAIQEAEDLIVTSDHCIVVGVSEDGDTVNTVIMADQYSVFSAARTLLLSLRENISREDFAEALNQIVIDGTEGDPELQRLFGVTAYNEPN